MATTKTYPFSLNKHAHDIELYANRLKNIMYAMESGEIPMDDKRYDKIYEMYYGPLMDLRDAIYGSYTPVAQLTGPQIGLAKKIVFWASETRAESLIKAGKTQYLKYC